MILFMSTSLVQYLQHWGDQTKADLTHLRRGRGPNSIHFDVVNQAKDSQFSKDLEEKENWIHVLIHDEAHWGIAQDSKINSFLQNVANIIKNRCNACIHRYN